MAATRSPLFDDIHNPRLADLVRASTVGDGAVLVAVSSAPQAPVVASSHRTDRTDRDQRSFSIATPLGTTSRFSSPI